MCSDFRRDIYYHFQREILLLATVGKSEIMENVFIYLFFLLFKFAVGLSFSHSVDRLLNWNEIASLGQPCRVYTSTVRHLIGANVEYKMRDFCLLFFFCILIIVPFSKTRPLFHARALIYQSHWYSRHFKTFLYVFVFSFSLFFFFFCFIHFLINCTSRPGYLRLTFFDGLFPYMVSSIGKIEKFSDCRFRFPSYRDYGWLESFVYVSSVRSLASHPKCIRRKSKDRTK